MDIKNMIDIKDIVSIKDTIYVKDIEDNKAIMVIILSSRTPRHHRH